VSGVPVTVASLEGYMSDLATTPVGARLALVPAQACPEVLGVLGQPYA